MPRRKTALRRRAITASITPEMIETLITGDLEGGAVLPRRPDFGGRVFRNLEHAGQVWRENRAMVLRIHANGWKPEDGEATLYVKNSPWLRGSPCWAECEFDGPAQLAPVARDTEDGPLAELDCLPPPIAEPAPAEETRRFGRHRVRLERDTL